MDQSELYEFEVKLQQRGFKMNQEEMKEYMEAQCYEIAVYKWIESEKAGRDLGDQACMDWIKKYAPSFRKYWEETHKENA